MDRELEGLPRKMVDSSLETLCFRGYSNTGQNATAFPVMTEAACPSGPPLIPVGRISQLSQIIISKGLSLSFFF
jgi:hypothetical protein